MTTLDFVGKSGDSNGIPAARQDAVLEAIARSMQRLVEKAGRDEEHPGRKPTQERTGEKTGLSQRQISMTIGKKQEPSLWMLVKMRDALGCSFDELLGADPGEEVEQEAYRRAVAEATERATAVFRATLAGSRLASLPGETRNGAEDTATHTKPRKRRRG